MSGPIEHLETERLVLRPMTVGDVEEMHEIYSDETTFQFIAGGPCRSIDETLERVQEKIAHQKQQGFSLGVVIERSTGMVVGDCGLQLLEGGPDVEVGYKMARRVRGRGYATEAAAAWIAAGFNELGLERVVAVTHPDNVASRRVMLKLGMSLHGTEQHYGQKTVLYVLTRQAAGVGQAG